MLISNLQRYCLMKRTGALHRVSRGHEVGPRFAEYGRLRMKTPGCRLLRTFDTDVKIAWAIFIRGAEDSS
jgi:hypothetical protein